MSFLRFGVIVAAAPACAALFAASAHAHVSLQDPEAIIGSSYKAVFRVPHGCQGSATTAIRVRVPEGIIGVKPQPKAGWQLDLVHGEYAQPHQRHGATVTAGVKEVKWSGGPLLDEHYDEFVFMSYLSGELTPGNLLYFPVVQECQEGAARWIDQVSPDDHDHSDTPAPALRLLPQP